MDSRQKLRAIFGDRLNRTTHHSEACQDCDADLRVTENPPGVFRLSIIHDSTCPTFRRMAGDPDDG